jgi:signal transduction histidine kinase
LGPRGNTRLRADDFDRAFRHPDTIVSGRRFDFVDGLPDRYARQSIRSLVQGGDGRIWAATLAGTVWIDPKRIKTNTVPPPVSIGALVADGKKYLDPINVQLPAGTSSLTIGFAALSLSVPERNRILYKLEGQDAKWVNPAGRRLATYTNLGPGKYRFRVIAANADGFWNREGATLEITIPPTFLQSIWFKMLVGLVLLALGAIAYLLRVRQLEARLQARFDVRIAERERIARELHDTLLQGFQALMLQFKAGVNRLPASERKPLDDALVRAQGVLVEGRDRVRDLRAPRSDAGLETVLLDLAADIATGSCIDVRMTSEGTPQGLHPIVFEEIERICEEAIRNVVHHSEARSLRIDLLWGARDLKLAIRDDGKGIPEDVAAQGSRSGHYGLVGMRERAERIGADLTVSSRLGNGTEVVLSIPAAAAYSGRAPGLFERFRSLFSLRKRMP